MLSLVLRGKLGLSEDVLTAAVFDAIEQEGDASVLRRVFLDAVTRDRRRLELPPFDEFSIELWPWTAVGEPDVRIVLKRQGGEVGRLLVEAKLGAQKSGTGELTASGGDQLARYLRAEWQRYESPMIALVYLTHHADCPQGELDDSAQHLVDAGVPGLAERLFWVSWRDLEAVFGGWPRQWGRIANVLGRAKMFRYRGHLPDGSAVDWSSFSFGWAPAERTPTPPDDLYLWPEPPDHSWGHSFYSRHPRWPSLDADLSARWSYTTKEGDG